MGFFKSYLKFIDPFDTMGIRAEEAREQEVSSSAAANLQNISEAQKTRDWQTEMSNTAYQRAAADMEKAGLNRILALGSPATTPGGATAKVDNIHSGYAANVEAARMNRINSMVNVASSVAGVGNTLASTAKVASSLPKSQLAADMWRGTARGIKGFLNWISNSRMNQSGFFSVGERWANRYRETGEFSQKRR